MAVYKRTYAAYRGAFTARPPRFLILVRYSFARLFQSKFLILAAALCLVYPIGCAAFIYLSHNPVLLVALNVQQANFFQIDGRFFYFFCVAQGAACYLMTALIGPTLIAPDLANGALPLYFCRPFSRTEYALGKLSVLMIFLSGITWVPGLILFGIHASLAGMSWFNDNLWLAGSIILGLLIWNLLLSFIALAVSALVRWKIAAGALILGVFFAGAGFGFVINTVMNTSYGSLIDLTQIMHTIWSGMMRYDAGFETSLSLAWSVLAATTLLCIWLIWKRIRAFEVVR